MKMHLIIALLVCNVFAFAGGSLSMIREPEVLEDGREEIEEREEEDLLYISSGKQEELDDQEILDNRERARLRIPCKLLESHLTSNLNGTLSLKEDEFPIDDFRFIPTEDEMGFYQLILDNAPKRVQRVLFAEQHLQDHPLRVNRFLLVGKQGAGKSTLAKAMACYLGECYFVPSTALLCKYRNGASEKITALIKSTLKKQNKIMLIIDGLNKLTDNYTSEYTDSSQTASALCALMDTQEQNPNFFLICTANESKKLTPELQSRFQSAALWMN